jgi:succinate dehydrogenase / fumarate reductase, cytochrome b subunit
MSWITKTLTSSIGKKLLMALTGLFLCSFLIVHMVGNLQLFKNDQGLAFNTYAVLMTTNPLIKTVSYALYALILFHAVWGLYLEIQNRKARGGQGYAVANASSTWASRNMALLGTVLLVFIAVHMSGFWFQYKFGHVPYKAYVQNITDGSMVKVEELGAEFKMSEKMQESVDLQQGIKVVIVKDLYKQVAVAFKQVYLVIFYVLCMFSVAFHLIHGFQSAFQTIGWNHKKYTPLIKFVGVAVFGILIPLGFAAMPIYFFFQK